MQTVEDLRVYLAAAQQSLARLRPQSLIRLDTAGWKYAPTHVTCDVSTTIRGDLALIVPDSLYSHVAKRFREGLAQAAGLAAAPRGPDFPRRLQGQLSRAALPASAENVARMARYADPGGRLVFLERTDARTQNEDFIALFDATVSYYQIQVRPSCDLSEHLWRILQEQTRRFLGC